MTIDNLQPTALKEVEQVTNGAAIGYMILAAKELDLPKDTIRQLEREMYCIMDYVTEEQAEKEYQNS